MRHTCFASLLLSLGISISTAAAFPAQQPANPAPLTNQDVVLMTKSNFGDATIVQMIQTHEPKFDLSVAAVVKLKEDGVAERVIQEMLASYPPQSDQPDQSTSAPPLKQPPPPGPLDPQAAAMQLEPGAYFWTGQQWEAMQQVTTTGTGAKHVAGAMFVPGMVPQVVYTFRGGASPLQIHEQQPLFCVKFPSPPPELPYLSAPSPRDIAIARFDQKSGTRELQVTSGGTVFNFKTGVGKDRLVDVKLTTVDQNTVLVTPAAPLRSGEYFLSADIVTVTGCDFGVPQHEAFATTKNLSS